MFERLRRAFHHRDVVKRVERDDWTAMYVNDYDTAPTWAYTIGFHWLLGAPEVIVFDLPPASANGMFHEIYKDLKDGLVLRDGQPWRPGELDHPAVWREVHPSRLYGNDPEQPWLSLAETLAMITAPEKGEFTAFQLVLCDPEGHLPWEAGYDERLRPLQRALWEPIELAAAPSV